MVNLTYQEQVKHFNAVMARILNVPALPPLVLDGLDIKILSCHYSIQPPGLAIEEHEHPNYELTFMECGEMTTVCEEHQITCTPGNGSILFIPPATLHHRTFGSHTDNINMSLVFTVSGRHSDSQALCAALADKVASRGYREKMTPSLQALYQEIKRQAASDLPLTELAAENLLYAFVTIFFQQYYPDLFDAESKSRLLERFDFESNRVEAIKRTLVFMLREKNVMRQLSASFGMSPRHLNRIFKAETGSTISCRHQEMKLAHARNLLSTSTVPIAEIAHSLGFNSPARFSGFFKRFTGLSPTTYRKSEKVHEKWK